MNNPTTEAGWLHLLDMKKAEAWNAGYNKGLQRTGMREAGVVDWAANIENSILEVRWTGGMPEPKTILYKKST